MSEKARGQSIHYSSPRSNHGMQNKGKRHSFESERKRLRHEPEDDYDSEAEYLNFDKLKTFHIPRKKSHEERGERIIVLGHFDCPWLYCYTHPYTLSVSAPSEVLERHDSENSLLSSGSHFSGTWIFSAIKPRETWSSVCHQRWCRVSYDCVLVSEVWNVPDIALQFLQHTNIRYYVGYPIVSTMIVSYTTVYLPPPNQVF